MNQRDVGRGILWFAIGLVVAAVLSFMLRPRLPTGPLPTVLRGYAVKPEIAGELKGALTEAFGTTPWRVSVTADGRLLVSAPESAGARTRVSLIRRPRSERSSFTSSLHSGP